MKLDILKITITALCVASNSQNKGQVERGRASLFRQWSIQVDFDECHTTQATLILLENLVLGFIKPWL